MTFIEKIIITAIVVILALAFVGWLKGVDKFEEACRRANGEVVFDGHQYQCLKSK